jgi:hypothetical protein
MQQEPIVHGKMIFKRKKLPSVELKIAGIKQGKSTKKGVILTTKEEESALIRWDASPHCLG